MLELCQAGFAQAIMSDLVLAEAARNIHAKLSSVATRRFNRLCIRTPLRRGPPPSPASIRRMRRFINEKDAPVLAAAVVSGADILLTLDQQLMTEALRYKQLPIRLLTPGQWLQAVLV